MNPVEHLLGKELEASLRFEAFMAKLSARFINLPADQLDGQIEDAQRLICENFGLDRSSLFQRCEHEPEKLLLTHLYQRPDAGGPVVEKRVRGDSCATSIWVLDGQGAAPPYVEVEANTFFPWITQQLRKRQTVVLPNIDAMPPEAALDRERLIRYGTKSGVVVPLFVEDTWLGCLTFASMRERRTWPGPMIKRVEFVGDVFTNALARKKSELALRESQVRLTLATESAGAGLWSMEADGSRVWVTPRTRAWFRLGADEELTYERFSAIIHAEDRDRVREAVQHALTTGEELLVDYRVVLPEGTVRWVSARGRRHCSADGKPQRLMGASVDITERKLAEEALSKSYAEIKQLKERLEAESAYLKAEIKVSQAHGQVIGRSQGIKQVLHQVEQVASAECAVLLTGETGTGKELIAQEIHRLSRRRDRIMVLVNCAALPSGLVESELFGRERGAYTGALTTQVGRFEMANGSTIFLDEVGELSTEVQAKLLRVLQEGEFQRLGSPKTHKVDVRVFAATNRDLAAEVRKGRFREDLYYRLKVFPIAIPPLRDRGEDIPLLVFSFMEEFATRMGKRVTKVSRKAMERLQQYAWPGNIRELRNVIEHSVIVSSGDVLTLSLSGDAPVRDTDLVTLAEAERDHILRTLESTRWRIKGPHGAAHRLALQPSTLYSRMQKLGIPNRRQKDEMATES